jgi:class 3 adenylate cyclase
MKLYENYIENLQNVISRQKVIKSMTYSTLNRTESTFDGENENTLLKRQILNLTPLNSLEPLMQMDGTFHYKDQKLGEHPDFKYLKQTNGSEYHYITSVFIDIKNSTGLFKIYSPSVVMEINNIIQRAAIHTCVIFGGYIQRLQGDGVFVYFGGKGVQKKDSMIRALNATSFFTYFVKNDLKKVFEGEGIEDIYTRIGIDFGDDNKVLWALAGIGECSEITTCSLHTSLASKMQGIANANGIVVGENIKNMSLIDAGYFDWVKDSNGEIKKRYIFEDRDNNFYYKALDFDWYHYLKSLSFIYQDSNGELFYQPEMSQTENDRINELKKTAALIGSGNAYTDKNGLISENVIGTKNMEHRFHYEEKNKNSRKQV